MTQQVELKPCPFCAGNAVHDPVVSPKWASCATCGYSIRLAFWNTRLAATPVPLPLREDIAYLCECAEQHADKFPVPAHLRELLGRIRAALNAATQPIAENAASGENGLRQALRAIRDWQLRDERNNPNVPEDFKGSPFDYLKKMANDALKASASEPNTATVDRETLARTLCISTATWEFDKIPDGDPIKELFYTQADAILGLINGSG
jgi:hypothetical protein